MAGTHPVELAGLRLRPSARSAQRKALGPDVEIDIDVIDKTNTRVNVPKLIRRFRKMEISVSRLVGVQTNQYLAPGHCEAFP